MKLETQELRIELRLLEARQKRRVHQIQVDISHTKDFIQNWNKKKDERDRAHKAQILSAGERLPPLNKNLDWERDSEEGITLKEEAEQTGKK